MDENQDDCTLSAENVENNDEDDINMQKQPGGLVKRDRNLDDRDFSSSEGSDDEGPVVQSRKRIRQFSDSESESIDTAQRVDNKNEEPKNSDNEKDDSDTASEEAQNKSQQLQPTSTLNRKVIQSFSDSDSDSKDNKRMQNKSSESDPEDGTSKLINIPQKSRLCKVASDSDSDKSQDNVQESRTKNKKKKLREKFQYLLTSRSKENDLKKNNKSIREENSVRSETKTDDEGSDSAKSSDENDGLSIEKMKQKIKEKTMQLKTTLYDPDTSDEESQIKQLPKHKKARKSTKPTSPKPLRMSAKQAMENMQKIKSESNRMLRESDVSLPYHRPKALSLKDILSRRKPAVTADGKALPIKMNEDQLKHYAQLLEERQKEMIELCKSESEEEEITDTNKSEIRRDSIDTNKIQGDAKDELKSKQNDENEIIESSDTNNTADVSGQNDSLFDDLSVKTTEQVNSEQKKTETEEKHGDVTMTETNTNETNISLENMSHNIEEDRIVTVNYESDKKDNCKNDNTEMIIAEQSQCRVDLHATDAKNKDQETENTSADISLVYNDSIEEGKDSTVNSELTSKTNDTEESQCISLHYDDSEKVVNMDKEDVIENQEPKQKNNIDLSGNITTNNSERVVNMEIEENIENLETEKIQEIESAKKDKALNKNDENEFSDDDINMEDIDALIENAEIIASQNCSVNVSSPMLIKDLTLKSNPKLTGAPGMIIDLDGTDPLVPKKLNGVELLKERYFYFAKLKTPEELERDKEKRIKPGTQHLKLKQELEEQIAEQRSLEWAKRLEEEKQNKKELDALRGDASDVEGDIDEIEAKLEENKENDDMETSECEEEEEEEEEQELVDKPRKKNPMVDDEAEESDCDEVEDQEVDGEQQKNENDAEINNDADEREDADDEEDDDSEESSDESESENEEQKPKKSRILKAFEDSDDEDITKVATDETKLCENIELHNITKMSDKNSGTQDDEIQLAQMQKSLSEDLFTSQASTVVPSNDAKQTDKVLEDSQEQDFKTQTFSIIEACSFKEKFNLTVPDKICDTQSYDDNLDKVVGMCSGSFSQSQNLVIPIHDSDVPASQVIGDDVLELCTGKFYDNQFVSQVDNENKASQNDTNRPDVQILRDIDENVSNTCDKDTGRSNNDNIKETNQTESEIRFNDKDEFIQKKTEDSNLKSILDELNDPEFDTPKQNKYFVGDESNKVNKIDNGDAHSKKRFVIDSDDDANEEVAEKKKKKLKKKKPEKRALQISDDEEEQSAEEAEEFESEIEEENEDKVFEYDSEENEVIVQPVNPKKKRKMAEFFENEAELTSEDEWIGSGDEDEAGLDRMEREAGDDETFNQNKLQRELGQIHMRDVLDQDKREVRLIQELLFEDGDLGDGHRQRKFRWRDAGEEEPGMPYDELVDTQEEEFESEEQWRKQRHEREIFLKQLKEQEQPEEALNVSVNRTSIIKANLSKNTTNLFEEINTSVETTEAVVVEKKTAKDIPSPKKPFTIFQQNYHGSLLTRGRGALARLAALATPLANDDDVPKASLAPSSKRNFVFAALEREVDQEPKVTKRKADSNTGTPRLVKKMRTEEKQKLYKSSLLDLLKS